MTLLTSLDQGLLVWVNHFMGQWPWVDQLVDRIKEAPLVKFAPMATVFCWLWFDKAGDQLARRKLLVETLLTIFLALIVGRFLALLLPYRERPITHPELHLNGPVDLVLRTWSSFPSDHAVLAFAWAAALFRISPRVGLWLGLHSLFIICLPRLYFAVHYPTDLLGGALIGIALAALVARMPGRERVSSSVLGIEQARPALFYAAGFFILFELSEMFGSLRFFAVALFRGLRHSAV